MNRCWALFLPLCCYLRLVSAEVSCDGVWGRILPLLPQPPRLAAPSSPCSELWSLAAREPGAGHWVAPRAQGLGGQVPGAGLMGRRQWWVSFQWTNLDP